MNALVSRLGLGISRVFRATCPDPFTIAIMLTLLTAVLALIFGRAGEGGDGVAGRALHLLDAWRSDHGLWKLLAFGMQMCLILVTGHALAAAPPVRRLIHVLAGWPKSAGSAAMLVSSAACLTALVNWGLGLVVGAVLAREVGRGLARRHIPMHYPLLAAAGYMGLLVFHGGLSGSAPLSATTTAGARRVLPESAVALLGGGVSLDRTLLSPLNLFVTGGLVVLIPLLFRLLTPARPEQMQPMDSSLASLDDRPAPSPAADLPERLDRSPIIAWMLALPLLIAIGRYAQASGLANIQLNEVNMAMLAAGLILHASPRAYMAAIEDGARDCGAVIVQFPIYAGIMAMMSASGLVQKLAAAFAELGDAGTLPMMSFFAATLVGLFVPSGGAQWGLQGEIALRSGLAEGIDPGTMIMSVAYGDQVANMLQPFWALPLLAITGVKARDIVGYTAVAMFAAIVWTTLGLLLLR